MRERSVNDPTDIPILSLDIPSLWSFKEIAIIGGKYESPVDLQEADTGGQEKVQVTTSIHNSGQTGLHFIYLRFKFPVSCESTYIAAYEQ